MSAKIFPHFWYAKEAEAAAKFYAAIFPDSRVDRVTPLLSESPSGAPGSVKVVDFTLFGQRFRAISAGPHHDFNDAISTGEDYELLFALPPRLRAPAGCTRIGVATIPGDRIFVKGEPLPVDGWDHFR